MIPLSDANPTRRFPVVCVALIVINVLVFLCDMLSPVTVQFHVKGVPIQQTFGGLSYHYSMIPAYVTGLINQGSPPPVQPAVSPAWITVFTAMFLHANWLHIGGNMLYLWIFGNNIEDVLGRFRFLLFYLACGIGAAALHIVSDLGSTVPTVGASGAIAGGMGAYLILYPNAKVLAWVPVLGIIGFLTELRAVFVIGFWFVLQLANSQLLGSGGMLHPGGGVAYLAHVGGFLTGALLIFLLGGKRLVPPEAFEPRSAPPDYDLPSRT